MFLYYDFKNKYIPFLWIRRFSFFTHKHEFGRLKIISLLNELVLYAALATSFYKVQCVSVINVPNEWTFKNLLL